MVRGNAARLKDDLKKEGTRLSNWEVSCNKLIELIKIYYCDTHVYRVVVKSSRVSENYLRSCEWRSAKW